MLMICLSRLNIENKLDDPAFELLPKYYLKNLWNSAYCANFVYGVKCCSLPTHKTYVCISY